MKKIAASFFSIIFVFSILLPTVAEAASTNFTIRPLNTKGKVLDFGNIDPGASLTGEAIIALADKLTESEDYSISFKFLSGPEKPKDFGSIINFKNGQNLTLGVGEKESKIPFTINIPQNIAPGDYSCAISASAAKSKNTSSGGFTGINITTASAFKINFSINGERIKKLLIKELSLEHTPDGKVGASPKASFSYLNDGNTVLTSYAKIVVNSSISGKVFEEEKKIAVAYPGMATGDSFVLNGVDMQVFWGSFDVTLYLYYDDNGKKVEAGHSTITYTVIPWKEITVIIALLALIVLFILLKYLRFVLLRRKSDLYIVCQGDTLQSVSTKFNADSQKMIIVNKLKSPFFLETGSKIFIPKK